MESLSSLHLLTEAVRDAGADIAPTYQEYIQLAFAIATDCGEVGRQDFLTLCSLSPKYDRRAADKLFSNALRNGRNNVHLGTAFHLAELCNVRPRPAEKPRRKATFRCSVRHIHYIRSKRHCFAKRCRCKGATFSSHTHVYV